MSESFLHAAKLHGNKTKLKGNCFSLMKGNKELATWFWLLGLILHKKYNMLLFN